MAYNPKSATSTFQYQAFINQLSTGIPIALTLSPRRASNNNDAGLKHLHLGGVLPFLASCIFLRTRGAATVEAAEAARPTRAARERKKRAAELLPPTETETGIGTGAAARGRGGGRLTAVTTRAMTATVAAAAVARVQGELFAVDQLQSNLWRVRIWTRLRNASHHHAFAMQHTRDSFL